MRILKTEFSKRNHGNVGADVTTPFPVTYFNFTDAYDRYADFGETPPANIYTNYKIINAHDLIIKDRISPYLAWAQTLGFDKADLPRLLKTDPRSCAILLAHPERSPPPEHIHHFCHSTGVHPAYLLPTMRDADYPCHFQILRAVSQVYKNPNMPERDRDIARKCLEIERSSFIEYKEIDPVVFSYLKMADINIRDLEFNHVNSEGFERQKKYRSSNPASDIDAGLDQLAFDLEVNIQLAEQNFKNVFDQKDDMYDGLRDMADMLFGIEYAEESLDEAIEKILKFEKTHPDYVWGMLPSGQIGGATKEGNSVHFDEPCIRENYEVEACRHGLDPYLLKNDFTQLLIRHVGMEQKLEKMRDSIDVLEKGLAKFQEWRADPKSESHSKHIPMLANYVLADRALGRQLLIAGPEVAAPVADQPSRHLAHNDIK